jgi:hypothetical protein
MTRTISRVAGLALALLLVAPPPAASEEECRVECREARRTCHVGALVTHRACHARCEDAAIGAAQRAGQECRDLGLAPRECAEHLRAATAQAAQACRERCSALQERARARCEEERTECVQACAGPVDPACAQECRQGFAGCRDDLKACSAECRTIATDQFQDCRAEPDAAGRRECFRTTFAAAHECNEECHESLACGSELVGCLKECAVEAE